jgi:predicted GTPase
MNIIKESKEKNKERVEELVDNIAELNPEAILLEPQSFYNATIAGYDEGCRVIYSVAEILQGHVEEDGMSYEEAIEFFEFNTIGTFMGMDNPNKPIFMYEE